MQPPASRLCIRHRMMVLGVLCSLAMVTGRLEAQTASVAAPGPEPSCQLELNENAGPCDLSLSPGETKSLHLAIPADAVRRLTIEQVRNAVEVRSRALSSPPLSGSEPYSNKAGIHSRISILVTAASAGNEVRITNPSNKPATVRVIAEPPHATTPDDAKQADAEASFAHAEALRATRDPAQVNDALSAYDHAIAGWRSVGDQAALARALIWKAMVVAFSQGKPAAAKPIAREALDLVQSLDVAEAANCWKIAGFIDASLADYDAAGKEYDTALSLFEKDGDLLNQEAALDGKARMARQLGNNEDALNYAQRALVIAKAIPDETRQMRIDAEIGAIYLTEGEFEPAYDFYEQALALLATIHEAPTEGFVWSDMGVLYTRLHDFDRARDALDQALAYWRTGPWDPSAFGQVGTLITYGNLLSEEGKPKEARKVFLQGLDLAKLHSQLQSEIYLLSGIGATYLDEGDLPRAEEAFEQARQSASQLGQGDALAELYCALGDLNSRRSEWAKAEHVYQQCRQAAGAAKQEYQSIQAEASLARVAYETDDMPKALQHADAAIGAIESVRGQLSEQDLKTSFFSSMHAYYDLDIAISMRLDKEHPSEGYAWKAFLVGERARSRSLLDRVTAANSPRPGAASPALLAQYDAVQRKLRALEAASRTSPQRAHEISASIAQLSVEEHQLHQEIVADNRPAPSSSQPLSLQSLEEKLPDAHSALVEYWTGTEASYAWGITRTGMRSFRLPPASQIDQDISALRHTILASASRDSQLSAEQRAALEPAIESQRHKLSLKVSAALFPPGLLPAAPSTVLVVGDGSILSAPLAALRIESQTARPISFLSEPSATIFSLLEANSAAAHPMRVAVFADGQLQRNVASNTEPNDRGGGGAVAGRFAPLPFTSNEAESIEAIFGPTSTRVFTGTAVSLRGLQELDWNNFSVGHFAMHAALNTRYAELTGLAGHSAKGSSDSMLWYSDICRVHMPLDLVVLSACNTALGEAVPGEGFVGLTQAFFSAGSQRVLGTLWPVDDQATSEWMRRFYLALRSTRSPATALGMAQREMAADPRWKAPYYWAGFVLAGDWRPLP
jgi:CHAT domain-containing protein/tetratricopeptide (TPR) repeat protein